MRFFTILLILTAIFTTSCFKGAEAPVIREDDKVRTDLLAELKQMEIDGRIIDNQVKLAQERISQLLVSPKMHDIAKKDMYQKEKFYQQIEQQISYLKIKINNREKYFVDNQHSLTREKLDKEFEEYSMAKQANPVTYPWRIPSMKKEPPPASEKDKKSIH